MVYEHLHLNGLDVALIEVKGCWEGKILYGLDFFPQILFKEVYFLSDIQEQITYFF